MPFTFKLSNRLARIRSSAFVLSAAAAFACEPADRALSSPSAPNFVTSTGNPVAVTDLAVTAVSDTSLVVSFTEVDDGLGGPPSYDVRFADSPSSWGSPTSLTPSCDSPISGTPTAPTRSRRVVDLIYGT